MGKRSESGKMQAERKDARKGKRVQKGQSSLNLLSRTSLTHFRTFLLQPHFSLPRYFLTLSLAALFSRLRTYKTYHGFFVHCFLYEHICNITRIFESIYEIHLSIYAGKKYAIAYESGEKAKVLEGDPISFYTRVIYYNYAILLAVLRGAGKKKREKQDRSKEKDKAVR